MSVAVTPGAAAGRCFGDEPVAVRQVALDGIAVHEQDERERHVFDGPGKSPIAVDRVPVDGVAGRGDPQETLVRVGAQQAPEDAADRGDAAGDDEQFAASHRRGCRAFDELADGLRFETVRLVETADAVGDGV